jgi:hypothetical protein
MLRCDRHPMSARQIDAFFACAISRVAGDGSLNADAAPALESGAEARRRPPAQIFLATDNATLRKQLRARHRLGRGGAARLIWWDGPVATDVAGMQGALIDLWLLGYTDDIIASHGSTFGYVAHGRVGVAPLLVSEQGACTRELSAEPWCASWCRSCVPLLCVALTAASLCNVCSRHEINLSSTAYRWAACTLGRSWRSPGAGTDARWARGSRAATAIRSTSRWPSGSTTQTRIWAYVKCSRHGSIVCCWYIKHRTRSSTYIHTYIHTYI